MLSLVQEVMVLVVGMESLPMVSLLGALPLVLNTGMGGVVAWSWKGGTVHGFLFVVLVLFWLVRGGSLIMVTMVVLSLLDVLHLVINTSLGEVTFLSLKGYGPRFPFRGSRTPPMGQEWSSHGGSRFDRMDRCIDRHGRMNIANPTFEEMAGHWFATFGTNPIVESFARSRSWF
jgi:hypothetical protein